MATANDAWASAEPTRLRKTQFTGAARAAMPCYKKTTAEEISSLRVENTSLREEIASLKKMSQESRQLLQEAECAKNEVEEECARMVLEIQTKVALKEAEREGMRESCLAQVTTLKKNLEEQTEDLKRELKAERSRKTINAGVTSSLEEEVETWRKLYEDLKNKTKPFQQQLDAFEAEKSALLHEHGAAQEELNKLSEAYAELLGHQNHKQKIKHVLKLKEENAHLKQDVSKLRVLLAKEKQTNRDLQGQLNAVQGIRRCDPSTAFQHTKENIPPETPLEEGSGEPQEVLEDVHGWKGRQGAGELSRAGGPAQEALDVGAAAVVGAVAGRQSIAPGQDGALSLGVGSGALVPGVISWDLACEKTRFPYGLRQSGTSPSRWLQSGSLLGGFMTDMHITPPMHKEDTAWLHFELN
nr:PREDICTED: hyaluronan mediated motility receptor-like [Opisthocomus hoazin]